MPTASNRAALETAVKHFNNTRDREAYFELYAENAVFHRAPPLPPGKDAIKIWYRSLWSAFPDLQLTLGNIVAEDDCVANNFNLQGTHLGEFLGVPATGRTVTFAGVTILKFKDAKCVERWSQSDVLGILRQIGGM